MFKKKKCCSPVPLIDWFLYTSISFVAFGATYNFLLHCTVTVFMVYFLSIFIIFYLNLESNLMLF